MRKPGILHSPTYTFRVVMLTARRQVDPSHTLKILLPNIWRDTRERQHRTCLMYMHYGLNDVFYVSAHKPTFEWPGSTV